MSLIDMAERNQFIMTEIWTELCRVTLGGSLGGYACDILTENLSQREGALYKCQRCEGIMKDASISNTGEQVCVCCLKKGEQSLSNAPVRVTILSLKCSCPLSKRGCDWLGKLDGVEHHLAICGHVHVSCELMCGVVTTRGEMGIHLIEECPQREAACLHCSGVHKVCEMEEHMNVCGEVELMCELGCGTRVCRDGMLCHRENECPEETVMCPYEKYRCEVVGIKRRELEQHLKDNSLVHLELKVNTIESETKLELNSLKNETQAKHAILEEMNRSLKDRIKELASQLELKDKEIENLKGFVFREATVKWTIMNIQSRFIPGKFVFQAKSEDFLVAGYRFKLCQNTDIRNFNIYFVIFEGEYDNLIEWPLRAIFITRIFCHRDPKQSITKTSQKIEFQQAKNFEYKLRIFYLPLSTDMNDFISSDSLDLEVTIRILKDK